MKTVIICNIKTGTSKKYDEEIGDYLMENFSYIELKSRNGSLSELNKISLDKLIGTAA